MDVFHFGDISQFNDPPGGEGFQIDAVLGIIQIRSSTVKCSDFGKFQIFFEFLFFCVITTSKSIFSEVFRVCTLSCSWLRQRTEKIDKFTAINCRF